MKLITHNLLKCSAKGVTYGYPLKIEAEKVEIIATNFNPELMIRMLSKIRFDTLKFALSNISITDLDGIEDISAEIKTNVEILKLIHHALFEIDIVDGFLVCPESGRKFPVKDGIPNMLLHEDEV